MSEIGATLFNQRVFKNHLHSREVTLHLSITVYNNNYVVTHTLHVHFSDTSIFLAARSLCTNFLPLRYVIPAAISLQNFSNTIGNFTCEMTSSL